MGNTLSIFMDQDDTERFTRFLDAMGRRATREELLPILKENFLPLVTSEKAYLSSHTQSGALEGSLSARSGAGDKPGTLSVFSAPTATTTQLKNTWGKRGRRQQQGWAASLQGKGRRRVFYGPILHQGHRVVKRNAAGELFDTGKTVAPIPFASQAMDSLGEQQAEAAAEAMLKHIVDGG